MAKGANRFERFCYRNRNKGIPNLMLYISIGSAVVYLMSLFGGTNILYQWLCFDRNLILQGQVWRLFSYVLTYDAGNILFTAISLLCYFSLGQSMEKAWGTCKFNLFYLTGVLLMDLFCMIFGGAASVTYLNLSLFLGFATMHPDAGFMLLFIIPVKAWIFALFYLGVTVYNVVILSVAGLFPYNLYPFIAIANYFLFFGKDVVNLFPLSWQAYFKRHSRKKGATKDAGPKVVPFPSAGSGTSANRRPRADYNHRCTVCGRTDISDPQLEFRYCSKCKGYYCYCEDHISTHAHIE